MSSAEEDYNDGNNTGRDAKKRRVQRACDMCRRKKGDGGQMPGNKCSNCLAYNMDCTYVEAAKKRGPPKGYVEGLEHRLEKMQALLNQLCPNADFTKELGPAIDRESWPRERHTSHSDGRASIHPPPYPDAVGENTNTESPEGFESSDDDALQLEGLHEQMKDFHVGSRFFGKSSGVRLIKTAMDFKMEYSGKGNPIFSSSAFGDRSCRQEFWTMHPWEDLSNWYSTDHARLYAFPDPDLLAHLVDLYFENQNSLYPLLHRPTFERTLQEASHLEDEGTGAVVLLVCAIGSRYSNDPRVRMDGEESWGSSGWKWFQQVRLARKSFLIPPALCDIQIFSLACIFLQGCSAPQVCWTLCGVGIRLAQDVGAHRKKVYSTTRKVEDELWRRAFWVLVAIDREMSASLGRPCAIQEEDFDLDFPVDCDDEYWEHPDPKQAFKQPPGKPSKVAFFISYIRLNQILSFALRTIYSINKSKALLGFVGPEWDQRIVAELDSTLNKWLDEIPSHLHWPPAADGPSLFFRQSAVLYTEYYELQIMVHRPFIPSTQKPSKLSFPSLAICTNAARACSHIVDSVLRRFPGQPTFEFQLPAFTAAIVLLLHIWGHKRAGQTSTGVNLEAEMQCVHHCMQALKASETRWHTAGRLWDVLYELASVGDLPLPAATFNAKRERDEDDGPDTGSSPASVSGAPSLSPAIPTAHNGERIIAGSRRAHAAASHVGVPVPASAAVQHTPSPFDLPVHTNELGGIGGAAWFGGAPPPSTDPRVYGMSQDVRFVSQQRQQQQPQVVPFAPLHTGGMSRVGDMQVAGVGNPGAAPPGMFDSMMVGMTSEGPGAQSSSVDMWSNVPTGYGFEDWDSYITNISWMQQPGMDGQQQQQSQPPMR